MLTINEIAHGLPHRYPFLLVDKVLEVIPGKSLIAIKNVTINEPFFQGHFPNLPVMPGVLILEALAQATALLAMKTSQRPMSVDKGLYYLGGIDNARFKKTVTAGDQLRLEVFLTHAKQMLLKFKTEARVDNQIVCSADILGVYKEVHG